MYSDQEIDRLNLLRQATEAGESISQIAGLSREELTRLVAGPPPTAAPAERVAGKSAPGSADYLTRGLNATRDLDAPSLESVLMQASTDLSQPVLLNEVIEPLMRRIGELWQDGELRVANEHLASAVVRSFLGSMLAAHQPHDSHLRLIATTPTGVLHEHGSLVAAITAASTGWHVTYLGPNLPAEDIAGAVTQEGARIVALSLAYPSDDPRIAQELLRLRRLLPDGVSIIVGGTTANSYASTLDSIGAIRVESIAGLRHELVRLSKTAPPKATDTE